jgi:hypothetical protein
MVIVVNSCHIKPKTITTIIGKAFIDDRCDTTFDHCIYKLCNSNLLVVFN